MKKGWTEALAAEAPRTCQRIKKRERRNSLKQLTEELSKTFVADFWVCSQNGAPIDIPGAEAIAKLKTTEEVSLLP